MPHRRGMPYIDEQTIPGASADVERYRLLFWGADLHWGRLRAVSQTYARRWPSCDCPCVLDPMFSVCAVLSCPSMWLACNRIATPGWQGGVDVVLARLIVGVH